MEKFNVVFLDFDGVINTLVGRDHFGKEKFGFNLPKAMMVNNLPNVVLLSRLCLEYDLKIVVISTWRFLDKKYPVKEVLYNSGLSKLVDVHGMTSNFFGIRSKEIEKYLNEYPMIENFIIIDDLTVPRYSDHLVKCNLYDGFNEKAYENAKELIEKSFIKNKKR
jgi:hypothetical protein